MRLLLFFLTMLLTICISHCNVYDGSQLYDRFYFIKIDTFENGTTREKIPKQNTPNIRDYLLFDIENNIVRGYFVFNKIEVPWQMAADGFPVA